jgi:hypothetical protein
MDSMVKSCWTSFHIPWICHLSPDPGFFPQSWGFAGHQRFGEPSEGLPDQGPSGAECVFAPRGRGRQVVIRMGTSKKEELVDWSIVTSKRTCKNSELLEHLWPYSTFSCKLQVKWSYMTFPNFFLGYYTKNRDFTNKKRDWTNWLKQQNQRDLADKTADHIWS